MIITEFPRSQFSKLQKEIKYTIGKTLFVFKVFEDRIEKSIFESGKKPLVFQMLNSQSSWVRMFNDVEGF